jgi:hypothetical protein
VRSDIPGPLSTDESELLDALLGHEFAGVQELRQQARHIEAKSGCTCGCGTIDFVFDGAPVPRSEAPTPVPVEGRVAGAGGDDVGGLILFLKDGMLQSLEIYSYDKPLPLPLRQQVTWLA